MAFQYIKALHIIFVVTWFAGLFYIVRLFVYITEAHSKPDLEKAILLQQFKVMAKRLWFGITWPSAILTLVLGLSLLHYYAAAIPIWLWIKLGFVILLFIYHIYCHKIYRQLMMDRVKYTNQGLRLWNEVATILLVAIVFLVVLKSALSMVWGLIGLVIFSALLMAGIKTYKILRNRRMNP